MKLKPVGLYTKQFLDHLLDQEIFPQVEKWPLGEFLTSNSADVAKQSALRHCCVEIKSFQRDIFLRE